MKDIQKIVNFINWSEALKTELRHATKSDFQKESVADHTWRLSLMLILIGPKLKLKIDLLKALKLSIIHDLVEIDAKDIPILQNISNKALSKSKEKKEKEAIKKIKKMLGSSGQELFDLWQEFELGKTDESKVVKALDKLEGQLQFLKDPIRKFELEERELIDKLLKETQKSCQIDPFLEKLDLITLDERKKRIS